MSQELFKKKDKIQTEALNAWYNKGQRGLCQLATGAGKSRIGVRLVDWYINKTGGTGKVVIITPTENLRDGGWPKEFRKWGKEDLLDKIEIVCMQTLYKRREETYGLVIDDEFHNHISTMYGKFYTQNKVEKLLALSAWIPFDLRDKAEKIAPLCYDLPTDRAVAMGLIAPYIEYNVAVTPSPVNKAKLELIQQEYSSLESKLGGRFEAYDRAVKAIKMISTLTFNGMSKEQKEEYHTAKRFWKVMQDRRYALYECSDKIEMTNKILDTFNLEGSIIFSQSIEFADVITATRKDTIAFHSKVPNGNLDVFSKRENGIKYLSTCKKVREGLDLPQLPAVIITSNTSKPKDHIQIRGRCLRIEEDKTSHVFNLYIPNTQDEKWLRSAQTFTDPGNIKWVSNLNQIQM